VVCQAWTGHRVITRSAPRYQKVVVSEEIFVTKVKERGTEIGPDKKAEKITDKIGKIRRNGETNIYFLLF
jgi:hypothetical protein